MKYTLLCLSLCLAVPQFAQAYASRVSPDTTGECVTGRFHRGRFCKEDTLILTPRSQDTYVNYSRQRRLDSRGIDRSRRTRRPADRPSHYHIRKVIKQRGSTQVWQQVNSVKTTRTQRRMTQQARERAARKTTTEQRVSGSTTERFTQAQRRRSRAQRQTTLQNRKVQRLQRECIDPVRRVVVECDK